MQFVSSLPKESFFFKNRIKFFLHILSGIFPVERKLSLSHHLSTFESSFMVWVVADGWKLFQNEIGGKAGWKRCENVKS